MKFLAITTHPRIYAPPTPLGAALEQVDAWLESPSVVLLPEASGYWVDVRTTLEAGRVAGPRVHDARIAALCRYHAVHSSGVPTAILGAFRTSISGILSSIECKDGHGPVSLN